LQPHFNRTAPIQCAGGSFIIWRTNINVPAQAVKLIGQERGSLPVTVGKKGKTRKSFPQTGFYFPGPLWSVTNRCKSDGQNQCPAKLNLVQTKPFNLR
jgi:hypothetical protein